MDVGVTDDSEVDYPDVGKTLAKKVQDSEFERGILVLELVLEWLLSLINFQVRAVCVNDAYTARDLSRATMLKLLPLVL